LKYFNHLQDMHIIIDTIIIQKAFLDVLQDIISILYSLFFFYDMELTLQLSAHILYEINYI